MAAGTNQTAFMKFRVTETDKKKISFRAVQSGMSISEYMRMKVLSEDSSVHPSDSKRKFQFAMQMGGHLLQLQQIFDAHDLDKTILNVMKKEVFEECQLLKQ